MKWSGCNRPKENHMAKSAKRVKAGKKARAKATRGTSKGGRATARKRRK